MRLRWRTSSSVAVSDRVVGELSDLAELFAREKRLWTENDFVRADCEWCGFAGLARLHQPVVKYQRVWYPAAAMLHCLRCREVSRFD
jgi:hypothetical protein